VQKKNEKKKVMDVKKNKIAGWMTAKRNRLGLGGIGRKFVVKEK
jgi:hypothetical protein